MSRARVSYDGFEGQPSPASSDDRSLERQASVRVGRSGARVSIARSSRGNVGGSSSSPPLAQSSRQRSSRVRRPTPVARRSGGSYRRPTTSNRSSALTDEGEEEDEEFVEEVSPPVNNNSRSKSGRGRRSRMQADIETNSGQTRRSASLSTTQQTNSNPNDLSWYERLLPECFLNLSAPFTGYENNLDTDVDDEEYEILERQRLKRNKRIRRRLLTVMLIATAAGVLIYTKGRMFRKVGVKAAMSTMKHRLEDGFAKSIQETMGK